MESCRILIVDDLEDNLRVIGNILGDQNATLTVARNGKDAIKSAIKKTPDLIILDISMPEMDGYEVCSILKSNEITKEIPIIFLTALSQTEDLVKGFKLGAADYVTKPFQKEELLARVNAHLNLKKTKDIVNLQKKILEEKNCSIELQKNKIEKQHLETLSSIRYAQQIQSSIVPNEDFLMETFPQSFVLYLPKDIVSGDFYWIKKHNNHFQIAVADSTGHGIPGALLSMLGISLLNEITSEEKILPANLILQKLKQRISSIVKKNIEQKYAIQDGIDIALCSIDLVDRNLSFAGAYNSVIIVKNDLSNSNLSLTEFKGDKINISFKEEKLECFFSLQHIKLNKGDRVFMFTDGYPDQFGGPKHKKILKRNFKELLIETSSLPINKQKEFLHQYLLDWKTHEEQTDDILVIGFSF